MINRRGVLQLLASTAVPCSAGPAESQIQPARASDASAVARRRQQLASVQRWGYQLRLLNFAELAASPFDLLVIDHGLSNGRDFVRQWRPDEIDLLKTKPDGSRRIVLAYLSIGEAERYRFYWNAAWFQSASRPGWLGQENPLWPGNYPVEFWQRDWQRFIVDGPDSYLARLASQGFDGLYLDRADVYEELRPRRPTAARDMAVFVSRIAAAWRKDDPQRLVVLQNAEELIVEAGVRASIDAIAKEDLYFGIEHRPVRNSPDQVRDAERWLKQAQRGGKRIFVVEYIGDGDSQRSVADRCRRQGFVPHFADRLLGRLVIDPTILDSNYSGPLVPQENRDF